MLKPKEPTLQECEVTLATLTCDCALCKQELDKLKLGEMEKQTAITYCKQRLGLHEDVIL